MAVIRRAVKAEVYAAGRAKEQTMPTDRELDRDVVLATKNVGHPCWLSSEQAARIAGAAYLIQYVTSVFPEFYVRPALIVQADAATTASNIVSHAQLFRIAIVCD